jgi:hypothetical protein
MTTKNKVRGHRHGDIAFFEIAKLPDGLTKSKTDVLLQEGSGGNPHSFKGGTFYPKTDGQTIGYFEARKTTLYHVDHGVKKASSREAKLPDGLYEVRRQVEKTHEGMKVVVD